MDLLANLPLSLTVTEYFFKNRSTFLKVMNKYRVARFYGFHNNTAMMIRGRCYIYHVLRLDKLTP